MRNTLVTFWESKDFRAGMRVNASQHTTNSECIVGYNPGSGKNRYCIIALSDGAIYESNLDEQGVIDHLNKYKYVCQRALNKLGKINE